MKLFSPQSQSSRPITDRVKESVFNVLCNYGLPEGAVVADLFCGVGSLGLEALSRGAEFVSFVEQNPRIIATLERNIEKAGFVKESKVIRANAFKIGEWHGLPGSTGFQPVQTRPGWPCYYGLVFVDPPYADTREVGVGSPLSGLLDLLQEQVADDGLVVVRTSHRTSLSERYGRFGVIEQRQWGTMAVTILKLAGK